MQTGEAFFFAPYQSIFNIYHFTLLIVLRNTTQIIYEGHDVHAELVDQELIINNNVKVYLYFVVADVVTVV